LLGLRSQKRIDEDGSSGVLMSPGRKPQVGWVFHFVLEAQDGRPLPPETPEELIDQIIAWVEERGLQIGGGFREPTYEEANPAPLPLQDPRIKNVRPGIGLEDLLFGQTVEGVERLLGPAPESSFERDDDGSTRTLVYPDNGIVLFFSEKDDFRLTSIEISLAAGVYYLFGMPLLGVDKKAVIDLLGRRLSPVEMRDVKEELFEAIEESAISVPALGATFYFGHDGILEDLHWGPLFGPDDEVIWPVEGY
jgi:hypothetical protein